MVTRFGYDGAEAIYQLVGMVKTTYTYGPGLDEVLLQEQGTTALYLLRDGLNSTIVATNATGAVIERYAYDAYGKVQVQNAARQPIVTAPQTPWLFTGRYYHPESKLYDFRNRAYHPAIGRFMQVDPIGFAGEDYNLYRYVWNAPTILNDPLGTTGVLALLVPEVVIPVIITLYVLKQTLNWAKECPNEHPDFGKLIPTILSEPRQKIPDWTQMGPGKEPPRPDAEWWLKAVFIAARIATAIHKMASH